MELVSYRDNGGDVDASSCTGTFKIILYVTLFGPRLSSTSVMRIFQIVDKNTERAQILHYAYIYSLVIP